MWDGEGRTASSTAPNSSNLVRRAVSSVCHARPLCQLSAGEVNVRKGGRVVRGQEVELTQ